MVRGNAPTTKVHYKGSDEDFIVLVESAEAVAEWKKDKSVPLAQVVSGFKVFITHKQGVQGVLDTASHGTLESEFGTHKDDDVIAQILEKGDVQENEEKGRSGDRNMTKGPAISHNP